MTLKPVLTLGLALSALALAAPVRYEMKSYIQNGGKTGPAYAWCDAPDRVLAVTQPAKADLTMPQPASLVTWLKGVKGNPNIDTMQLGPTDAGAGQVYTALTPPGMAVSDTPDSYIHSSNIENVQDPAYRMTHINEFRLDGQSYRCRYVPQAAFLGVTNKRTVIIWDNGKTATYATRNFDGTPGVSVTGGKPINFGSESGWGYQFTTKDGYTYTVTAGDDMRPASARTLALSVSKGGKTLQTEPFLAYSISRPAKEQP
ncbi:hypothetical protein DEIPH_ctg011orf0150 [Deinococcus phoenicis]|uniref:Uncharacterized protein n=1 Tax=Deinococcus phoenicis TaxID=1476583 RepID=A0A016QSY5_9DEIO|nr:hypothetical protein [Deinococcus phoenicis]EYB69163.1 hypothetical protein DEIPH_ctg011orf0150 [Deinococcus phoenicis]